MEAVAFVLLLAAVALLFLWLPGCAAAGRDQAGIMLDAVADVQAAVVKVDERITTSQAAGRDARSTINDSWPMRMIAGGGTMGMCLIIYTAMKRTRAYWSLAKPPNGCGGSL